MAIYHLSAQIIKRSEGRSAIAAAAYRAGERLVDRQSGHAFDYRNKSGIVHTEIRTPGAAPGWMRDREELWNVLEFKNRRKDAQLAREMNIALPRELGFEQQKELLRRFVDDRFVARGMVADRAIHHDAEGSNPHAHVMLSFYAANENGFLRTRTREWNGKDFLHETRESWSLYANRALEGIGVEERIDHRTLEAQGIDRLPTIHEGPKSRKARDRGYEPPVSNVIDLKTYAGTRRRVDYREIDAGRSRAQQNARIHAFNERQVTRRLAEAFEAVGGWLRHRFLEASIKRTGVRLQDARRMRRSADGSMRFWQKRLKQRWVAATLERVFGNGRYGGKRLKWRERQVADAKRRIKKAKWRHALVRQRELSAERDYRQAKLALGRDRKERHARKRRSIARWTTAVSRVAPESVTLDRLPEGKLDRRWADVMGWMATAARAQRERVGWGHSLGREHDRRSEAWTPDAPGTGPWGQAPASVEPTASMAEASTIPPATPDEAWQRQAELKNAYTEALAQVPAHDIHTTEIMDSEREALLEAKNQREEQAQEPTLRNGKSLKAITINQDTHDDPSDDE
ncbi:MAG: MobA/MobL family protein [Alphaproteobacteria bacterium]|nr:MobA/MobL family protein [Alphaproteobacteria bacterium]